MAPKRIYYFDEDEITTLRGLIERERGQRQNPSGRPHFVDNDPPSPEVYVAVPPVGGIPARTLDGSATIPGSAECSVYRKLPDAEGGTLEQVPGLTKTVCNASSSAISADTPTPIARDKFGQWWAQAASGDCCSDCTRRAEAVGVGDVDIAPQAGDGHAARLVAEITVTLSSASDVIVTGIAELLVEAVGHTGSVFNAAAKVWLYVDGGPGVGHQRPRPGFWEVPVPNQSVVNHAQWSADVTQAWVVPRSLMTAGTHTLGLYVEPVGLSWPATITLWAGGFGTGLVVDSEKCITVVTDTGTGTETDTGTAGTGTTTPDTGTGTTTDPGTGTGGGGITVTAVGGNYSATPTNSVALLAVPAGPNSIIRVSAGTMGNASAGTPVVTYGGLTLTQVAAQAMTGLQDFIYVFEGVVTGGTSATVTVTLPGAAMASLVFSVLVIDGLASRVLDDFGSHDGTTGTPSVGYSVPATNTPSFHGASFLLKRAGADPVVGTWGGTPTFTEVQRVATVVVGSDHYILVDGDELSSNTTPTATLTGSTQDVYGAAADAYR